VQVSDFKVIDWEQQQAQPQGQPTQAVQAQAQNTAWQQPQAPVGRPMTINDDDLPF
jgi:single-stranded DNA-binding protein